MTTRSPMFNFMSNFSDERLKTFVVVEVFEGHQLVNSWKCGDLVQYVNHLGSATPFATPVLTPETSPYKGPSKPSVELEVPKPKILKTITEGAQHYHYFHGGARKQSGYLKAGQPGGRPLISQLTYRDLRQV